SILPPPSSVTPFPYTTLFRSPRRLRAFGGQPERRERPNQTVRGRFAAGLSVRHEPGSCCRSVACLLLGRARQKRRRGPVRLRREIGEHTSELQSRVELVCRLL